MNRGSSSNHNILIILSALIVVGGAVFYWHIESTEDKESTNVPITPSGSPASPAAAAIEKETYTIEEISLSYQVPRGFEVDSNVTMLENGTPDAVTLTIQRGNPPSNYYQLYMITQFNLGKSDLSALENLKEDFQEGTAQDVFIAGYPGVSGQIQGERNRFVTYFIKDEQIYTVATAEPTEENKQITEDILNTFKFN